MDHGLEVSDTSPSWSCCRDAVRLVDRFDAKKQNYLPENVAPMVFYPWDLDLDVRLRFLRLPFVLPLGKRIIYG